MHDSEHGCNLKKNEQFNQKCQLKIMISTSVRDTCIMKIDEVFFLNLVNLNIWCLKNLNKRHLCHNLTSISFHCFILSHFFFCQLIKYFVPFLSVVVQQLLNITINYFSYLDNIWLVASIVKGGISYKIQTPTSPWSHAFLLKSGISSRITPNHIIMMSMTPFTTIMKI